MKTAGECSCLDGEELDILLALLDEGDHEVERPLDVRDELVLRQLDVADGNADVLASHGDFPFPGSKSQHRHQT